MAMPYEESPEERQRRLMMGPPPVVANALGMPNASDPNNAMDPRMGPPTVAAPPMSAPSPMPSAMDTPPPEMEPSPASGAMGPPPVINPNREMPPSIAPVTPRVTGPPPVAAGPPKPGPEEQRLREMMQAGPKTSVLGSIAGGLMRAGAAYANSSNPSRPIAHVNEQRLQDWAKRSPTGGPWSEKIAQQKTLADMEAGDTARDQAWAKQQADIGHVQAQTRQADAVGDWHKQQADNDKEQRRINAKRETDQAAKDRDTVNLKLGEAGARVLAPGETPPADHYVFTDSLGRTIAQPSKTSRDQEAVDLAWAQKHDIIPNDEEKAAGRVWIDRRLVASMKRSDASAATAAAETTRKAAADEGKHEVGMANANRPRVQPGGANAAATAKTKTYYGSLQRLYGNDYAKIREHIANDDQIDDGLRADADKWALQQQRLAREPAKKGSLLDALKARQGQGGTQPPPPVNLTGGGRGAPVDPLGIRQ